MSAGRQGLAIKHVMTSAENPPAGAPKRILLVEDDLVAAHTLRLALSVDGYAVEVAGDAEQGLTMLEGQDYDLVITDFKLPKMDGLELAEAIKKHAPSRPVILITAYAESVKGALGAVSNVDVLLGKPVSLAKLQEALQKIFSAKLEV